MLTLHVRLLYILGYAISQITEALNGAGLKRIGNHRRELFIAETQTVEELLFGNALRLLNIFVESLDLVALMLNEIGWHFADCGRLVSGRRRRRGTWRTWRIRK